MRIPDEYKLELIRIPKENAVHQILLKQMKTKKVRSTWPRVSLWLPFESPRVVPLVLPRSFQGSARKAGLLLARLVQRGTIVAFERNLPVSPPSVPAVLPGSPPLPVKAQGGADDMTEPTEPTECQRLQRNRAVARRAVKFLAEDTDLVTTLRGKLARRIPCGTIKAAIRSLYPSEVTPLQELSLKTAFKLEKNPCGYCKDSLSETIGKELIDGRFPPVTVDRSHLARFKRAVGMLVPSDWDRNRPPYVPTGGSTPFWTRGHGGNWKEEEYYPGCDVVVAFTSSKMRAVTRFSSRYTEVLTPLHSALYRMLQREGWLLVGDPTDEEVKKLGYYSSGEPVAGDWLSLDYKSATDNILVEYCQAVVEVLKEKAGALTDEEVTALDDFCHPRFLDGEGVGLESTWLDGVQSTPFQASETGPVWTRGQPMGSAMSFPVLCLINKAVVDLALVDLAESGKISWKQFRGHRCLINGDDCLTKEPLPGTSLVRDGVSRHGTAVGLVVNLEKTMSHPRFAEINSTLFEEGVKQKKTNLGVLRGDRTVSDPVGFIHQSVRKARSWASVLPFWRQSIKYAWPKFQGPLPRYVFAHVRRMKSEALFRPRPTPAKFNPFSVVTVPAGYYDKSTRLTKAEKGYYITRHVVRLRESGYNPSAVPDPKPTRLGDAVSRRTVFSRKTTIAEERILKVLADGWMDQQYKRLLAKTELDPRRGESGSPYPRPPRWFTDPSIERVSDLSLGLDLVAILRASTLQRRKGGLSEPEVASTCPPDVIYFDESDAE